MAEATLLSRELSLGESSEASYSLGSAGDYGNDASVEAMWAIKAIEHAEVYFNLLCSVNPRLLKLTPHDDKIYDDFVADFPHFNIGILIVEDLKSEEAKKLWRPFCNRFEGVVEDFNFGTLLRINADKDYTEENTILVTRIQFYAIEIARNRSGVNDKIRSLFKPKKKTVL